MKTQTSQARLALYLPAVALAGLLFFLAMGSSRAQTDPAAVTLQSAGAKPAKDKDKADWVAEKPEELHQLYAQAINEGNVEAVVMLFEKDALLVPRPGQPPVQGEAAIRTVVQGLVALHLQIQLIDRAVVQTDEIALTRGPWQVQINDANGVPQTLSGTGLEVARRQPNGTWRYVMVVGGNE